VRENFGLMLQTTAGPKPVLAREEKRAVPGPHGDIGLHIYWPSGDAGLPIVLFIHGGGWCIGSAEQYAPLAAQVAAGAHAIVVSVDYRLAPEHPFPVPYDEAYAALRWVAANAADLGGDASRIALWGDSAGGNLSAAVAQRARDENGPALALQVLVYPALDTDFETVSHKENGEGYFLERAAMHYFWGAYAGDTVALEDPRLSVLRARDLAGLPPALVITAEFDPLRDEGDAYARALADAGVSVEHTCYDGMIHGFAMMGAVLPAGQKALQQTTTALRRAFGTL
jgi:acetyl esterase